MKEKLETTSLDELDRTMLPPLDDDERPARQSLEHVTRMQVCDLPKQVTPGQQVTLRVGVKCSMGCDLGGHTVGVLDDQGEVIAKALLGEARGGSSGLLYWAEVPFCAPEQPGAYVFQVAFAGWELEPAHPTATKKFRFKVMEPHDARLHVVVFDELGDPIQGALVRVGTQEARTGNEGVATLGADPGVTHVVVLAGEIYQRYAANVTIPAGRLDVEHRAEILWTLDEEDPDDDSDEGLDL